MSLKRLAICVSALALAAAGSARASEWIYSTTSGGVTTDIAEANIAYNGFAGGTYNFTIQLTALTSNVSSDGILLSGVELVFNNVNSSGHQVDPTGATLAGQSGQLIDFGTGAGFSNGFKDVSGDPNHWGAEVASATSLAKTDFSQPGGSKDIFLATVGTGSQGGQPDNLIVGDATSYSGFNPSVTNHQPDIQGTGTFIVKVQDTVTPLVSGIVFQFGTSGGSNTYAGRCVASCGICDLTPVPEPTEWALMLGGFFGIGALLRAHRRQALARA
ncbi:hypothetical protein [Phenylobacterium sp.]|jgi:hypothetical protein|uniref:hypothetical protein n=1 Tax=Phenylobacterium sp. TaxID=1871053 RepID=UPI002F3F3B60